MLQRWKKDTTKEGRTMLDKSAPSMLRQQWLHDAERALRKRFADVGYVVPDFVRTSIGFPKGTRDGKLAIGQCWGIDASTDKHAEVFISPALGHTGKSDVEGSIRIMGVQAHEYAHAVSGNKAGHRIRKQPKEKNGELITTGKAYETWFNSFPVVSAAVGLESPWTATTESPEFITWAKGVIRDIGHFPAGALSMSNRKKDVNRQRKCQCATCGYIARTTKKWVEAAGPPICPTDKTSMICEGEEEDDSE